MDSYVVKNIFFNQSVFEKFNQNPREESKVHTNWKNKFIVIKIRQTMFIIWLFANFRAHILCELFKYFIHNTLLNLSKKMGKLWIIFVVYIFKDIYIQCQQHVK